jgi:hypothetical protein
MMRAQLPTSVLELMKAKNSQEIEIEKCGE